MSPEKKFNLKIQLHFGTLLAALASIFKVSLHLSLQKNYKFHLKRATRSYYIVNTFGSEFRMALIDFKNWEQFLNEWMFLKWRKYFSKKKKKSHWTTLTVWAIYNSMLLTVGAIEF